MNVKKSLVDFVTSNKQQILGWVAVALSTAITCFWAMWGILENFHEGWYYESFLTNLGMMFIQYLSPMLIFMGVTLISIYWPRLGGSLHVIFALFLVWYFGGVHAGTFLLIVPLLIFGILYWVGRPQPRKVATRLAIGLPLLTLIIFGVEPIFRVSQRINDGNLQARLVEGNGVNLIWAPDGPGWPRQGPGGGWYEAREVCQYLAEDGTILATKPQNIWRLPTVDEAVRSMSRHGKNSGGVWDAQNAQASYQIRPDKESPLWNVHSLVIYWWTGTEIDEVDQVDEQRAYIIAYDGKAWPKIKQIGLPYRGFRCVKTVTTQ